ncbi:hypothetical protein [Streptomyces sp. MH60]|uniref:hypothetical protein n=1 Tax=Streptomyces sp. MH60 TaxID=1940758 RepID=UPI000CEF1665|nr:hypothetical protein [Streptomyces sp. MH60]PPS89596.1 hypothetical protein BZZ08_01743 [Streptomyces sp. MH60]
MIEIKRKPTPRQVEALRTALDNEDGIVEVSADKRTHEGLVGRGLADWKHGSELGRSVHALTYCVITDAGRAYLAKLDGTVHETAHDVMFLDAERQFRHADRSHGAYMSAGDNADETAREEGFGRYTERWYQVVMSSYASLIDDGAWVEPTPAAVEAQPTEERPAVGVGRIVAELDALNREVEAGRREREIITDRNGVRWYEGWDGIFRDGYGAAVPRALVSVNAAEAQQREGRPSVAQCDVHACGGCSYDCCAPVETFTAVREGSGTQVNACRACIRVHGLAVVDGWTGERVALPAVGAQQESVSAPAVVEGEGQQYGGITREDVANGNGPAEALWRAGQFFRMYDARQQREASQGAVERPGASSVAVESQECREGAEGGVWALHTAGTPDRSEADGQAVAWALVGGGARGYAETLTTVWDDVEPGPTGYVAGVEEVRAAVAAFVCGFGRRVETDGRGGIRLVGRGGGVRVLRPAWV